MVMRIGGLGSGMDIDKLVFDLMRTERIPVDRLNQNKQKLTWKSDAYREINTKLAAFRASMNEIRFGSTFSQMKAISADPTKVTVSAAGTANPVNHSISVESVASAARLIGGGITPTASHGLVGTAVTAPVAIDSTNNQLQVTVDGTTRTLTLTSDSYADTAALQTELQKQLDKSFGSGKVTVGLDTITGQLSITPNGTAGSLPQVKVGEISGNGGLSALGFQDKKTYKFDPYQALSDQTGKLSAAVSGTSFTVNGVSITYNASESLQTIINRVNSSAAGVNMTYDPLADKLVVTSKTTGYTSQVTITDDTGSNFATVFNLTGTATPGTDAKVTIDNVTTYRSTNQFTVDSVTYTLNGTTSGNVSINVAQDMDAMVDKIKDFVSKYNDLMGLINTRYNEPKYRTYLPLTDEQKSAMNDSDIESWESKAKSGIIGRDTVLGSIRSNLRSITIREVSNNSTYNALYQVGITTSSYAAELKNEAGKLTMDESKLRQALADDSQGVMKLFSSQPDPSASAAVQETQKGLAQVLYEQMDEGVSSLADLAGYSGGGYLDITTSLGVQMKSLEDKIYASNARLSKKEEFYYKQFTAMDQAMAKGNAQLNWLASQMGMGG